jgi:uncharacterized protein (DUF2384 family)
MQGLHVELVLALRFDKARRRSRRLSPIGLGQRRPIDLLGAPEGAQLVDYYLGWFEYAVCM